jgi:hypothetical protein
LRKLQFLCAVWNFIFHLSWSWKSTIFQRLEEDLSNFKYNLR